LDSNQQPFG